MGYAIHGPVMPANEVIDPLALDDAELLALFPDWPAVWAEMIEAVTENEGAEDLAPAPELA